MQKCSKKKKEYPTHTYYLKFVKFNLMVLLSQPDPLFPIPLEHATLPL